MKKTLSLLLLAMLMLACNSTVKNDSVNKHSEDYTKYVNPLIGTSKMGHVYPGATVPWGMVQLSPQTNFEKMFHPDGSYNAKTYEYCAGYQYKDSTILGFSHTNFSGTGHSDLGDILIMPTTGKLVLDPLKQKDGEKGFYSIFSHKDEVATPGYYNVNLNSYNIRAELTASERVGMHKYTFPKTHDAHIILDMVYNIYQHDNKNVWTFIRVENDTLVTGYRQTAGWARTRKVFFAIAFSKPFKNYGNRKYDHDRYTGFYRKFNEEKNFPEMAGRNIRAYFDFDTKAGENIELKVALSSVSTEGAIKNMTAEIPGWNFNKVKNTAKDKWNKELAKVKVETINNGDKINFYTSMYHACLSPVLYEDVDGQYRGLDQNIHQSDGFTNYTIFSLWDTYRALHPLLNLLHPDKNNDMIKSMLAHQEQSVHHMLPIWSHYANENWCMIGYHAVSVLADAAVKGVGDFDIHKALNAAIQTSKVSYFDGIGDYMKYHYVPCDKNSSSVSKTLEYAYDDWCIAQLAKKAGESEVEKEYSKRSEYYKNVYDSSIGYMRPKLTDGSFKKEFDPLDTEGQGFIEGNAWNYSLYVPQNIDQMISMMGGKDKFTAHLDSLFTMYLDDKYIEKNEDITRDGMIGNYVHGNEPSHHIPYLYNWTHHPEKTQERVRMIMNTMYLPKVDGLCGNDDAGQMSAWYIFSSLGFYPVIPGSTEYALGSPLVKKAIIHFDNGKTFTIKANNQSKENIYVKSVSLNGKPIDNNIISYQEIIQGGELVFEMSNAPK